MVVPIHIPPLRERKEDIPPLLHHFVAMYNGYFGFQKTLSPQVLDRLVNYKWPGNVRELKNLIERMIVMSQESEITQKYLPATFDMKKPLPKYGNRLKEAVAETETYLLTETFKECGSWQKVAEVLGVDFTTVYRKVSRYHLLNRH
jgi:transcriptional regulator with PAS, ATPase and Fis domain